MSGASSATVQLHESVAAAIPLWAVRVLSPYRRGQTVEQISRDIRVSRYQVNWAISRAKSLEDAGVEFSTY